MVLINRHIVEIMSRCVPDFSEVRRDRHGYWFRCDKRRPYYETFVIGSSQKYRILECSVSWGFFQVWDRAYGTHQMCRSCGLPNLRLGSKAIDARESVYAHDGSVEGIRRALGRIGADLVAHALPWYQALAQEANSDVVLQHGLRWIRAHLDSIPATIEDDLHRAITQASYHRWRVQMPLLEALKTELRAFAGKVDASKWQRRETGILAEDLLRYANEMRRLTGEQATS